MCVSLQRCPGKSVQGVCYTNVLKVNVRVRNGCQRHSLGGDRYSLFRSTRNLSCVLLLCSVPLDLSCASHGCLSGLSSSGLTL